MGSQIREACARANTQQQALMSREFQCSSIVIWNGYNTKINKLHPSDNRRVCMPHIKTMPLKWSKQQQQRAPAITGFYSSQRQWANGRANKISVLIRKPLNIPACTHKHTNTHKHTHVYPFHGNQTAMVRGLSSLSLLHLFHLLFVFYVLALLLLLMCVTVVGFFVL